MRPLAILFTNNTLAGRAGSELWLRDMATTLLARGHRPIAFSLVTGAVADDLRAATIPVVDDLDNVGRPPDIIHGHHHLETLIAALHFPRVPIVQVCHGWIPWEERPLRHPAVAKYIAVDETCADRLTGEEGIPPDVVDVLPNFVDLRRFAPRPALPPRPRRALVFSNAATSDGYAAVIQKACVGLNVELEIAGMSSGRVLDRPEAVLPGFDVVFAKARSALEALAVGCSVVVADAIGCGPLVTTANVERLRAWNFGVRALQHSHSVDWYRTQLEKFDAADSAAVTKRMRVEASLDSAADRLLTIYENVLRTHEHSANGSSAVEDQRAAARHLCVVARELKSARTLGASWEALSESNARAARELEARNQELDAYRRLTILRVRDRILRVPFVGSLARRAVRAIGRTP